MTIHFDPKFNHAGTGAARRRAPPERVAFTVGDAYAPRRTVFATRQAYQLARVL